MQIRILYNVEYRVLFNGVSGCASSLKRIPPSCVLFRHLIDWASSKISADTNTSYLLAISGEGCIWWLFLFRIAVIRWAATISFVIPAPNHSRRSWPGLSHTAIIFESISICWPVGLDLQTFIRQWLFGQLITDKSANWKFDDERNVELWINYSLQSEHCSISQPALHQSYSYCPIICKFRSNNVNYWC
jgi:hypothetical protein